MIGRYKVGGMSCAACSARVERAVGALEGVEVCSVNLVSGEMRVEGSVGADEVIRAVEAAGYTAAKEDGGASAPASRTSAGASAILRRILVSLCFLLPLSYISMGHMMGAPLPGVLTERPVLIGAIEAVLAAAVMFINRIFFINGIKGIKNRAPNMGVLVSVGSLSSFGYSLYALIRAALGEGAEGWLHGLYFESAAMVLVFISLGKFLEAKAKGKTTDAIRSLVMMKPVRATVVRDGVECEIDISELEIGDVFAVRAGERIATDAVVVGGSAAVDESMLTGESLPRDKSEGDRVYGATVSRSGYMLCRATALGEETALFGIIRMVKDASATKAPIAKLADKVAGVFVPAVLGISLVALVGWLIAGEGIGYAIGRAVSVLVISCPCALGLATPVAIMAGSGAGAGRGILFKTATALESAGRIKTVVFDKTGTITTGSMTVSDVFCEGDTEELLSLALSLERLSEHPIASAIAAYAAERAQSLALSDFETLVGRGVAATLGGERAYGVSYSYARELGNMPMALSDACETYASLGKTPTVFILGGRYLGAIAVSDRPKEGAKEAVGLLREMGVGVVLLSGDNELAARAVADEVGIDRVIAGVLPDGKAEVIRSLSSEGKVAMVGDGINDAPSLAAADLGIAVGCGTDIAIESAGAVLMRNDPRDVAAAVGLGRAVLMNVRENLAWAFIYNCIGIPMAAGLFGLALDPMFGAMAMSLSSVSVVLNALRLTAWRPAYERKRAENSSPVTARIQIDAHQSESDNDEEKGDKIMTVTMKVEGMMCPHCEARVKKTLEAIEGVAEAIPSHKDGTVTVTLSAEVDTAVLVKAVSDQGYPAELMSL